MLRTALTLLATVAALTAQDLPQRLGAVLRSDGILTEIHGSAEKPRLNTNPSTTRFLHFNQAAGLDAWAATTKDSLIYAYVDFRFRLPLDAAPTALALSADGKLVAVADRDAVIVYSRAFGRLNRRKTAAIPGIGTVLELSVSNNALLYITTAEKTYVHALDSKPDEFPLRATTLSDAPIAYDAAASRLVLMRYNAYSNKASVERIAGADDGLSAPTAISYRPETKIVWISQTGEHNLARLNLTTREIHLFTIPAGGVLGATSRSGIYTWSDQALLDTTGPEPKLIPIE